MKLSIVLLLIATLNVLAEDVYSQNKVFSLNYDMIDVGTVLKEIEAQSEFYFLFNQELVDVNKEVSINMINKKLDEILGYLFNGTDVAYAMFGKQVILSPRKYLAGLKFESQQLTIEGKVSDTDGNPLPGVNIVVKGTSNGAVTDLEGKYSISVSSTDATLSFSYIGFLTEEVIVAGRTNVDLIMIEDIQSLEEVVVIGYGSQKKSDITGAVASVQQERLEMVPNLNIAQAIQGAVPGVVVRTSSGGADPDQSIMIRGRNSILADNSPLVVVDGIPYSGAWADMSPKDVKSIEILKDASAAAIYGSRGANGVILITTKSGKTGKARISYEGYYSIQNFVELPDMMSPEEFYEFKMERAPETMTTTEQEIYDSKQWTDWFDLALRKGQSTEHNLSVSGGFNNTNYYVSGDVLKVKGLAINDEYLRLTSRINLESQIAGWLTIGTRTQLTYGDKGGLSPNWSGDVGSIFNMNPLVPAFDDNGKQLVFPWPEKPNIHNPLENVLATDTDDTYQVVTNNYAVVTFPFIPGLKYRINTGVHIRYRDIDTYYGKDTKVGFNVGGKSGSDRNLSNSYTVENILEYNREFGKNKLFFTGLYSYESFKEKKLSLSGQGFPHDYLIWYSVKQAEVSNYNYYLTESALLSQMLRFNYSYDSRYLITLTGRRDGYSGFGAKTKWGIFPTLGLGWNMAKENFFPWKEKINDLKWRVSYGLNGNQAIRPYATIARLEQSNYVDGSNTLPGYAPSRLGMDNLGWESSKTLNIGFDFGILSNRITGDLNYYKTNTSDLLLSRTISPVHGITSITQNIGKTRNTGWEASVIFRNIVSSDFQWNTTANFSWMKNEIVSLYGELDDEGKEIDDVASRWFIGHPIEVNYGYIWDGIWQLYEAEEAAKFGTYPGFVKIKDVDDDDKITAADRQIVGQQDPKFLWGLTNSWSYKNFSLSVFMHGVHGVTKGNGILLDEADVGPDVPMSITKKDFWTPENPDAKDIINVYEAWLQNGIKPMTLQNADFVRIKDITLSYKLPQNVLERFGFSKFQLYVTGRNLFTFTKWTGLDPELSGQKAVPLQKEYVLGINLGF